MSETIRESESAQLQREVAQKAQDGIQSLTREFMSYDVRDERIDAAEDKNKALANWSKVQDKKITDATLHNLASLSAFINFREPSVSVQHIFASVLQTKIDDLRTINDGLGAFQGRILCYALAKIIKGKNDKDPYQFEQIVGQVENKKYVLPTGFESLQRIQVSIKDFVNVPSSFIYLVKIRNGQFIFNLKVTMQGDYAIELTYPQGHEDVVNGFIAYLKQIIKDNNFYRGHAITPNGGFLNVSDITWNDWFGSDSVRDSILMNIKNIFDKEAILVANGVNAKRGIVISGPPGTGKTLFAKCLANELKEKVTFIWVTPKDVSWSEKVRSLYELAQDLTPAIVFLEDADMYLADRSLDNNNPILGELMQCLDGFIPLTGVVTILTSNRPQVLEGALAKRPGRFDVNYYMGALDKECRSRMIQHLFKDRISDQDISWLNDQCDGFTGAEIKNVYEYSVLSAVDHGAIKDKMVYPDRSDLIKAVNTMNTMRETGQIDMVAQIVVEKPIEQDCDKDASCCSCEDDDERYNSFDDDDEMDESIRSWRCLGSRVQVCRDMPMLSEQNYEDY